MTAFLREGQDVRRGGYEFTTYPPPGISDDADVVRRIREEISGMENFVPLWLKRVWEYPTGASFETIHVVLARMEIHPPSGARLVHGLPLGPNGEKYRVIDIANGLSQNEVMQGFIGRYQPLSEVFEAIKQGMQIFRAQKDVEDFEIEEAEDARLEAEHDEAGKRKMIENFSYIKRFNRDQLNQEFGHIARTFVSSTSLKLKRLREAAGKALKSRTPGKPNASAKGRRDSLAGTAKA